MSNKPLSKITNERQKALYRARRNYNNWLISPQGMLKKAVIFAQQEGKCAICKMNLILKYHSEPGINYSNAACMDHIIPLADTLTHSPAARFQILCNLCNNKKATIENEARRQNLAKEVFDVFGIDILTQTINASTLSQ